MSGVPRTRCAVLVYTEVDLGLEAVLGYDGAGGAAGWGQPCGYQDQLGYATGAVVAGVKVGADGFGGDDTAIGMCEHDDRMPGGDEILGCGSDGFDV